MGLSGKYNFKGIKKLNAAALRAAIGSSPATAWLLKFGSVGNLFLEFVGNWAANTGLVLFNTGAILVEGELDQKAFDKAMNEAIDEITIKGGRDKLTAAQKKAIDDEVIKAARKFIVIGRPK